MHIKGDFGKFDAGVSMLGAGYVASNIGISVGELCDIVYDEIKRKLYLNVVKFMLEHNDRYYKNGVSKEVERFINENYDNAKTGAAFDLISTSFRTDFVLAGVGAPIHIFLDDVAGRLGTTAVLPKHYEVANALGAIVGKVVASSIVEIRPNNDPAGTCGYTVFGAAETKVFKAIEEAEEFAAAEARGSAYREAAGRGAVGEIAVTCKIDKREVEVKGGGVLHLCTNVIAHAVGSIQ
jgi:N-methylhydantoinase A/oxoprolinase/acetone carboxylase beta subunit